MDDFSVERGKSLLDVFNKSTGNEVRVIQHDEAVQKGLEKRKGQGQIDDLRTVAYGAHGNPAASGFGRLTGVLENNAASFRGGSDGPSPSPARSSVVIPKGRSGAGIY